ncbi:hypothetical protein KBY23_06940 [Ruegeria pomeroyi]|nr:hypothetical protein [Ruegeria pomeroyi]
MKSAILLAAMALASILQQLALRGAGPLYAPAPRPARRPAQREGVHL